MPIRIGPGAGARIEMWNAGNDVLLEDDAISPVTQLRIVQALERAVADARLTEGIYLCGLEAGALEFQRSLYRERATKRMAAEEYWLAVLNFKNGTASEKF